MTTTFKALAGTVAAGAMAVSSVSPAIARDHNGSGIGAGEVIAGALIIGGIAAVAAAASDNDRDDRGYRYDRAGYGGDRRYDDRDWRRDGYAYGARDGIRPGGLTWRSAVAKCVSAAEARASRFGNADVTDIRDVRQTRWGYEVKGRIAVNGGRHGWRGDDRRYGQGWDGDYRGWNSGLSGYDSGRFECTVAHGRVVDVDFRGLDNRYAMR